MIRRRLTTGALLAAMALPLGAQESIQAQATFHNSDGEEIGAATLMETAHGVLIEFALNNIPQGEHAFHIHETGRCEAPDFKSAGGHYAPREHQHGYKAEEGYHAGDMPNQLVSENGMMRGNLFNPNVTLQDGEGTLFDDDGSAFVVHSGADDYSSQPSGDAGSRIACAVISRNGSE